MLKHYIIEKELGKGTYGVVYKAKKKEDNKEYVIKQISLQGLNKSQKDEVKMESEVLKSIESKYVVKYYESFEEENKLNIVMEYCECGDLYEYIEKQKKNKQPLNENIIWKFFIKITLGLADIHKLKILHRDLKSLNIFLKQENDVRVGDLGVAKVLNNTYFAKTFIGTPYYLSPELCEDKPYNDKSDVWALGCILYELCTYNHPFNAKSQGGLILKILNSSPEPISIRYSKDLKNLVNEIFNKDFKKRPSCLDILRMKNVIEKAKSLGIFNDIKHSFPDIETYNMNDKKNSKEIKNKFIGDNAKPIIMKNPKNNNYFNNPKKRPESAMGPLDKGRNKFNNIKFNNIRPPPKKKNDISNKKQNDICSKKIKIVPNKDKIINKSNNGKNNKILKKVIVIQKNEEVYKSKKSSDINKNNNNEKPNILLNNWLNTKDLNNVYKDSAKNSIITNDKSGINNPTINNKINCVNDNNDKVLQNGQIKNDINQPKDSTNNKDEIKIENNDNNNFSIKSIESDIYMTSKREMYQAKDVKKEEKEEKNENIEKNQNLENLEEKKITNKNMDFNNFDIEGSLPLLKTKDFNELISDFDEQQKEETNDFKIVDNDFKIIDNNIGEDKVQIIKRNIDNNISASSDDEINSNKENFSEDDKSNEENSNEDEYEKEKVIEIDENNDNVEETIIITNSQMKEKKNLMTELKELKQKIDKLKENISKLIGDEKFKYIINLCSKGVKDNSQNEMVKIEEFINNNSVNDNKEKFYDIIQLFILEFQYNKKKLDLKKFDLQFTNKFEEIQYL